MPWWEQMRRWLGREARDLREAVDDFERKADAALTKRERDLAATPEERLDTTLDEIAADDDAYEQIKRDLDRDP